MSSAVSLKLKVKNVISDSIMNTALRTVSKAQMSMVAHKVCGAISADISMSAVVDVH